jgi:hypothetical protein
MNIYIGEVILVISLSDAILIENFISFQITIASGRNKNLLFSCSRKRHFMRETCPCNEWHMFNGRGSTVNRA